MDYEFCVVGGGIVGLATALALLRRRPEARLVLVEKESALGRHQTGHNSGVIHAGIYYEPGSLKAELCRRGARATIEFAQAHGIPYEICGKLIVATNSLELQRMTSLEERAHRNGIDVERIDAARLRELEPNVDGLAALLVKGTGIIDYSAVARAMGEQLRFLGADVELGAEVTSIEESADGVRVVAGGREFTAGRLVACAGLQADRIATLAGLEIDFRIVPFRGEYYRLPAGSNDLVRHLIYPVPDPALPFLGVHLTRTIDGGVTVGPNAVLAFSREGYAKRSFRGADVTNYLRFPGMWRFARRNVRTGLRELRNSYVKRGYLRECRKYCPSLRLDDLGPEPAGIRAQAMLRDGSLVHDFLFAQSERMLHVCNAPSPAATSAIPIGELICDKVLGPNPIPG